MERYCAYQDRCHQEVRYRLIEHQVYGDELEEILSHLVIHGFLDEERFARSYARGKFSQKGWGKIKIIQHLKSKDISDYCVKKAMEELNSEDYQATLARWIKRRLDGRSLKDFKIKQDVILFCQRKGYAYEEILTALQDCSV